MKFPEPADTAHGKSALTRWTRSTSLTVKASVSATFADLSDWVVITGYPGISGGHLIDNGAVRYRDPMATDDYLVTATIGSLHYGKTWILTCASKGFDRFYAVEIDRGLLSTHLNIIKASGVVPVPSTNLFGMFLGIITTLFGFIFTLDTGTSTIPRYAAVSQSVSVNDVIGIRWDKTTSTIRVYRNGGPVTSLAVDHSEIPHGLDFRYFGIMQGIDAGQGVQFNAVAAHDV